MTIETVKYKGYTIKIEQDPDPIDPREWDNLGTLVCYSRCHSIGDKHEFSSQEAFKEWLDGYENKNNVILLPIYLLDHSGITISTNPEKFRACDPQGWDWGCVGVIYVTKERIKKEYSLKRNVTKKTLAKVLDVLRDEVETYDQYLTGDVYGYNVESPKGGEIDDGSCWGFFGSDHKQSGLMEQAQGAVDYNIRSTRQAHQDKLKAQIKASAPLSVRLAIA